MNGQLSEYNKLDGIDKKVLSWTLQHTPASVPSWIEHTVSSYRTLKGVTINGLILLDEAKHSQVKQLSDTEL